MLNKAVGSGDRLVGEALLLRMILGARPRGQVAGRPLLSTPSRVPWWGRFVGNACTLAYLDAPAGPAGEASLRLEVLPRLLTYGPKKL